ncbi:hypothetical protein F220043C3_07790 [Enterocloster asparagiformis]
MNVLSLQVDSLLLEPSFDSVHEFDDDREFYQYALGIARSIPWQRNTLKMSPLRGREKQFISEVTGKRSIGTQAMVQ